MHGEPRAERFVELVGAHVIAISGAFFFVDDDGNDIGDLRQFACTGFAMMFDGYPVLITAGHVIKDELDPIIVHQRYKGHRLRLMQVNLLDCFGAKPAYPEPTPYPLYADMPRMAVDESLKRDSQGLDFGAIMLPPLYWRGFLGNGGKFLDEGAWAREGDEFEVYKMVGIPREDEHLKAGNVRSVALSLFRSSDPDVRAPDGKPVWFIGTMPYGVSSVAGVSGGPIFGFRRAQAGWEYRIVAMQSWQKEGNNGLVYGTPLSSFGPIVKHSLKSFFERWKELEDQRQDA